VSGERCEKGRQQKQPWPLLVVLLMCVDTFLQKRLCKAEDVGAVARRPATQSIQSTEENLYKSDRNEISEDKTKTVQRNRHQTKVTKNGAHKKGCNDRARRCLMVSAVRSCGADVGADDGAPRTGSQSNREVRIH
jgi:hypothetical protein